MAAVDPVTQERIYKALKAEFLAGHFAAGERLEFQEVADRYRASKTPVREAAYRLMGEGLLEPNPDGGLRIARPTPAELTQLYRWNLHLLVGLLHEIRGSILRQCLERFSGSNWGGTGVELAGVTSSLFRALADASGMRGASMTVSNLNERLHLARIDEFLALGGIARELRILINSDVSDLHKSMRRRLESYHERRMRHRDQAAS